MSFFSLDGLFEFFSHGEGPPNLFPQSESISCAPKIINGPLKVLTYNLFVHTYTCPWTKIIHVINDLAD